MGWEHDKILAKDPKSHLKKTKQKTLQAYMEHTKS